MVLVLGFLDLRKEVSNITDDRGDHFGAQLCGDMKRLLFLNQRALESLKDSGAAGFFGIVRGSQFRFRSPPKIQPPSYIARCSF